MAGNWIPPSLSDITITNGEFKASASGMAGVNYEVRGTTDLTAPDWDPTTTNAAPFLFTDPAPATLPARFYRAAPETGFIP